MQAPFLTAAVQLAENLLLVGRPAAKGNLLDRQ
jgi:hypothetical protein